MQEKFDSPSEESAVLLLMAILPTLFPLESTPGVLALEDPAAAAAAAAAGLDGGGGGQDLSCEGEDGAADGV